MPSLKETCQNNYEALASKLRAEFQEPEIEQIYTVIRDLPTLNLELSIRGPYRENDDFERHINQPVHRDEWYQIHADEEYTMNVDIYRLGTKKFNSKIHCPKFPKGKDEGWFLTLGCQHDNELIAMKRVVYRGNMSTHQLCFYAPSKTGNIN